MRPLNRKELKDGARPIARTVDKNVRYLRQEDACLQENGVRSPFLSLLPSLLPSLSPSLPPSLQLVVLMDPNRDSDDILRAKRSHEHHYTFDVSFSPRATQDEVYQKTSEGLVRKVISGYNATVFAYGATGEWKGGRE